MSHLPNTECMIHASQSLMQVCQGRIQRPVVQGSGARLQAYKSINQPEEADLYVCGGRRCGRVMVKDGGGESEWGVGGQSLLQL